ncbi:MAG TPA: CRTAC1 family protein [Pyrinomonadaceae bacterium]|nr:CRTAC1 family protein [Pyrinomonadaceae bacterium]
MINGKLLFSLLIISFLTLFGSTCVGLGVAQLKVDPAGKNQQPAPQQTPSPAPARTGRSYDSGAATRRPTTPAPQFPSPVTFADITTQTGINFKHAASPTTQKYLPETMGGGVALFDYDNDGRLDIYFTNGALLNDPMPPKAQPDKRDPRFWNRLYHQKADGTFEDVTERAGVRGEGYSMGVAAGDFDNDGFVDLYVTAYGGGKLYRNRGDGTFEDVTRKTGVAGSGWTTSAGWFDYDRDGRLDLFVLRYVDWDFERGALPCGATVKAYCHPDNFKGAAPLLFHQRPDGTFEDTSETAGIADSSGKGLGLAFADLDNDGFTDVFVANDSVRQFLFHNLHDGKFEDVALVSGAGYDDNGKTFAGMGVDCADYDNDGFADVFVTTLSNETYPLFHNNGDLTFSSRTSMTGIGLISLLNTGWGTRFIDVDNDGWRDIFVAQGHVLDTIEESSSYLNYRQTPLLMRNTGKGFVNITDAAGLTKPLAARGAAFGDLDNDGDIDLVVAQVNGSPLILRNNGSKNHWLGIALTGSKSNRQGLGSRITVTDSTGSKQIFDVSTASSYLSASDPRVLVGLGTKAAVQMVEVRWPSGAVQTVRNPPIDKYLTITEQK